MNSGREADDDTPVGAGEAPRGASITPAKRLSADSMPTDFAISVAAKRGIDRILATESAPPAHPMRGFEPTYVDIVDYIVRITHRIWEEKDVGYIYDTYGSGARITYGGGLVHGRDHILAETVSQLSAFPDLRLHADEVIWAGDDEQGFRTSHRLVGIGHNSGWSEFGPPTGRKVVYWAIANCVVVENEIIEEWVLRDNMAILRQLGFDPAAVARSTSLEGSRFGLAASSGEAERRRGQARPIDLPRPSKPTDLTGLETWLFHHMVNRRNLSVVDDVYAEQVRLHLPGGQQLYGRGDVKIQGLAMLAMFPDLMAQVDDVFWMGNPRDGQLVSTRWSMVGTHRGHGPYGAPTGRRVDVFGITQHLIRDGLIVEEWRLFNEFDVLRQIFSSAA